VLRLLLLLLEHRLLLLLLHWVLLQLLLQDRLTQHAELLLLLLLEHRICSTHHALSLTLHLHLLLLLHWREQHAPKSTSSNDTTHLPKLRRRKLLLLHHTSRIKP
jgi:hypothetical protein